MFNFFKKKKKTPPPKLESKDFGLYRVLFIKEVERVIQKLIRAQKINFFFKASIQQSIDYFVDLKLRLENNAVLNEDLEREKNIFRSHQRTISLKAYFIQIFVGLLVFSAMIAVSAILLGGAESIFRK